MSQAFQTTIDNGIAELVINKPPVNALDSSEWFALAHRIDELGHDPEVRVIVIRAEGRGFCAGVDIKELDAHPERIVAVNGGNYATFKAVHRNPVPVIVAVHGYVLGGGIGITGAADIVLASECATFALPEVDRGAMGGGAHLQRLSLKLRSNIADLLARAAAADRRGPCPLAQTCWARRAPRQQPMGSCTHLTQCRRGAMAERRRAGR